MDRKKNRWKYGIWSAFVTILGVLLAVILVWVAEPATERFGLKFDLTANDRYAISEQSVSWLKKLDRDVKITVLVNEEDMATGSYYICLLYTSTSCCCQWNSMVDHRYWRVPRGRSGFGGIQGMYDPMVPVWGFLSSIQDARVS